MKNEAPTSEPRFVLVVALDASTDGDRVVASACAFARGIAGSELHLVHALEPYETDGFPAAEARERALARARGFLDGKAREAHVSSGVTVVGHLREGLAASAILQTAASMDADLVIVGTHDRKGIERWLLGSVSERVARDAACPVLIVRPKHHEASRAAEIEAPCGDCLRAQSESKGATLWCARHAEHHPSGHLHYKFPEGFGAGSSLIQS